MEDTRQVIELKIIISQLQMKVRELEYRELSRVQAELQAALAEGDNSHASDSEESQGRLLNLDTRKNQGEKNHKEESLKPKAVTPGY